MRIVMLPPRGREDESDALRSPCSHCSQMPTIPPALEVRAADTCSAPQCAAADWASWSGKTDYHVLKGLSLAWWENTRPTAAGHGAS